jgi:hypothetical protein
VIIISDTGYLQSLGYEGKIKMTDEQEDGQRKDETVLTCVVCGKEIRPEQGEEFKHVQDSKTGRDLFFCGEDGTMLAQLITGDFSEEDIQGVREEVADLYAEELG